MITTAITLIAIDLLVHLAVIVVLCLRWQQVSRWYAAIRQRIDADRRRENWYA